VLHSLTYAANQWGGPESRVHASFAKAELGMLRDARFVSPGLSAENPEVRLATISCVAFLNDRNAQDHLRDLAQHDLEAGIRGAALWAYGYICGNEADALLNESLLHDPAIVKFAASPRSVWRKEICGGGKCESGVGSNHPTIGEQNGHSTFDFLSGAKSARVQSSSRVLE
jgi:hypothetical protein